MPPDSEPRPSGSVRAASRRASRFRAATVRERQGGLQTCSALFPSPPGGVERGARETRMSEPKACPKCGKVYISEELAEGRMWEVEQMLEDK